MSAQLRNLLEDKRIALLGFGREGRSSYAFLRRMFPEKELLIADKAPLALEDPHVRLCTGENYMQALHDCDFLLKSPGISLRGVKIPQGLRISCQTDLFLRFAPCIKAGVTGTKGKTTTATLLYEMLAASGQPARLIGNMGRPVLDCMEEIEGQVAVIELSSHQLEFTGASPQVAVWTNLYEEHLDHYNGGFAGYAAAKANICRFQSSSDVFIYTAEQPLAAMADLSDCRGERIPVGLRAGENDSFLGSLAGRNARLKGDHNRQNIYFAATAALRLGASEAGIRRAVEEFKGIPHRMETVSTAGGIQWVDDCISTIPHSVLCALDALENVDTLILGGLDRGLQYADFAAELSHRPVRNVICLPETGHSIAKLLRAAGSLQQIVPVETMEEAVNAAKRCTAQGKTCLLSPAAASYNCYKDFEEKGRHFAQCIAALRWGQ
ncbi:MAG: UDP-N-acetylmuramoyl-L-alanine--D-glutamate ligase [Oscillospiraceae bacterium]|jgi:UDP-N-acetylmuramoylalanine--D-glutamate ligase|nr:UDP-N-acetylmuramoyl-L-alanine--D-glutamate ligase [Oscillospiraceae bacterium]